MSAIKEPDIDKEIIWTPALIKALRSKRTQADFGKIIGVPRNTVWRWEAGLARPLPAHARKLSKVAEKERFLADWQLVGSITLIGNLEDGSRKVAAMFKGSLVHSLERLVD